MKHYNGAGGSGYACGAPKRQSCILRPPEAAGAAARVHCEQPPDGIRRFCPARLANGQSGGISQTEVFCRSSLPPLPDGGFYWCDLLGLCAFAPDGAEIGVVADLMESGSTILVIRKTGGGELLAPFVDDYVPMVDIAAGRLTVDMPDAL